VYSLTVHGNRVFAGTYENTINMHDSDSLECVGTISGFASKVLTPHNKKPNYFLPYYRSHWRGLFDMYLQWSPGERILRHYYQSLELGDPQMYADTQSTHKQCGGTCFYQRTRWLYLHRILRSHHQSLEIIYEFLSPSCCNLVSGCLKINHRRTGPGLVDIKEKYLSDRKKWDVAVRD